MLPCCYRAILQLLFIISHGEGCAALTRTTGEMALAARRQAGRLGRLASVMGSGDVESSNELQPCRLLFGWAPQKLPAEPSVPARPAQRACGRQKWEEEYRCVLHTVPCSR